MATACAEHRAGHVVAGPSLNLILETHHNKERGEELMNRVRLKLDDQVVGYRSGDVLELSNAVGTIKITRQIDKDHYVNLVTGEIHKIHHNLNRASNIKSLKRTFRNIRRLVLSNFKGGDFWLTLTYAQIDHQPMRDTKRVYNDFFRFWRRF